MSGIRWQRVHSCVIGICLSLSCASNSLASVDICQQPTAYSHLSIAYYSGQKASFETGIGEAGQDNTDFDLLFKSKNNWTFGLGHRYSVVKVDGLDLQTNGHLHTFFLPLHKQIESADKSFRFSVAPALSASSNVMKDPGEYSGDAIQILAALVWGNTLSDRVTLRYGVCGDHRFGGYEIYPLISVDWQPHDDWTIELGFPTTRVVYKASRNISSSLRIAPDGNEWFVKDKTLQQQSQFVYEAILLEWAINWQAHRHFSISASLGRHFDNRYEMTLLDDSQVQLSSDPATRIGAAVAWRF